MIMCRRFAAWITVIAVLSWPQHYSAKEVAKKATLDPGTIQMLSSILDSLDNFRNDRLRDLEKIRLTSPQGNVSVVNLTEPMSLPSENSSVSEHIRALKEGIMGHNPVKKTFGYKVTVYTTPIEGDNKEGKPVLVTQYVGGDMLPETSKKEIIEGPKRRKDDPDDLQESANHPEKHLVHSSESAHLPIHVSVSNAGGGEGHEALSLGGHTDHNRKTEHSEIVEKGHQNGHRLHTNLAKGHDHEKHSDKHDEHHKETEKESHREDTAAHDKGGASQQGIRERTEIEYYEREHFLDTEYDKAKTGHDKTSGVKEHESHKDHDTHENKKLHAKENNEKHKTDAGGSVGKEIASGEGIILDAHPHYRPPIDVHYPAGHHQVVDNKGHQHLHEDSRALKEDAESSRLHHSEESKGHKEHNSERDLQSEQKDSGYLDKDKGRRKEGYRERGYKITAEREYFLNDAHHDKGHSTHTSGHKLKDQEGAAHGHKEGERDRGFVKEQKEEEAHDAAYDSKDKRYYDGEAHKKGFTEEKSASSSSGEKKEKEEVIPLVPPLVNYVEEYPHHEPPYPLPIVYAPSNDGAQAVLAYPPEDLKRKKQPASHTRPYYDSQRGEDKTNLTPHQPQPPLGGFDDDRQSAGYVGHASYKRRQPSPLVAAIKETIKNNVHAEPPSYSKSEKTSSEENSVRFPEKNNDHSSYKDNVKEEGSQEVVFPKKEDAYSDFNPKYENEKSYPEASLKYDGEAPRGGKEKSYTESPPRYGKEKAYTESPPRYGEGKVYTEPPPRYRKENAYSQPSSAHDTKAANNPVVYSYSQTGPAQASFAKEARGYLPQSDRTTAKLQNPEQTATQALTVSSHLPIVRQTSHRFTDPRTVYLQGAQNANQLINTHRNVYPQTQSGSLPTVGDLIDELTRHSDAPENQAYSQEQNINTNGNTQSAFADLQRIYKLNRDANQPVRLTPAQRAQQQQLLLTQQGARSSTYPQTPHGTHVLHFHHQQDIPRGGSALDQLQEQTKSPFSPVVLLSSGPSSQKQSQAVDVWYTRPRNR